MPKLLLTRPEADSEALATTLAGIGIESVISPVLDIYFDIAKKIQLTDIKQFICTSANGAVALSKFGPDLQRPLFAVGDATAKQARDIGFEHVMSASGDVDDLFDLISQEVDPDGGALFHAAGSATTGDLAERLRAAGYDVRREQLYEARAADSLTESALHRFRAGDIDGVVIYSPRTARLFDVLAAKHDLNKYITETRLFALSRNVAAASEAPWREILVAASPDQESLLDSVKTCYY